MNLRRYLVDALPVWALLFIGLLAYVLAYIEPSTTGKNWWSICVDQQSLECTDFLPDSVEYLDRGDDFTLSDMTEQAASITPFKQVILYWQAEAAKRIAPDYEYTVIFVMNFAIFMATVAFLCHTLDLLELTLGPLGFAALAFNPYVLLLVLTVNKDLWCFFAVAGAACAAARRSLATLLLFTALAMFVRDSFAVILVATYAVSRCRVRLAPFMVLCALGLNALPLVPGMQEKLALRDLLPEILGLRTAWLWQDMGWLQIHVPLGQLVVFPVTFVINVVADAISPSTWERIVSDAPVIYIATSASSFLFSAVLATIILRGSAHWTEGHKFLCRQAMALAFMISIYPILHHRYYLPAFLFFTMLAAAKPQSSSAGRSSEQGALAGEAA